MANGLFVVGLVLGVIHVNNSELQPYKLKYSNFITLNSLSNNFTSGKTYYSNLRCIKRQTVHNTQTLLEIKYKQLKYYATQITLILRMISFQFA